MITSSADARFAAPAGALAVTAMLLLGAMVVPVEAAPTNGTEAKCQAKIAKSVGKLWKTAAKIIAKCRDSEIDGQAVLPCPDAKGQAKIDKAAAKVTDTISKSCGSVCSGSAAVTCLNDAQCPPAGAGAETCEGGGDAFDLANLGFPGPFCPSVVGRLIKDAADLGACLGAGSETSYTTFVDQLYGTTDSASGLTSAAAGCLSAAGKGAQKVVNTIFKSVSKCRDAVNKGKLDAAPARCSVDDPKTSEAISKALTKFQAALASKCQDGDVAQLDICGNGPGGTIAVAEASACLSDAAVQLGDALEPVAARSHARVSLVDVAFPPARGSCGDGLVNQLRDGFLVLGEECDGDDDEACPGECLAPGDLFECTCGNIPRIMNISFGGGDLDIGWTGFSHNHLLQPGTISVQTISGCDCDEMNGAECAGSTTDPVCDVNGLKKPVCSWDALASGLTCDARGDNDSLPTDADCAICDSFSANAGSYCEDETDCQSQCHDASGTSTGPCSSQSDCSGGEVCRGRCDRTPTCLELGHGPPTALVSGGSPSSLFSLWTDDLFGTMNIVTGEHARFLFRRALSYTGELLARPAPVCGGVCVGSGPAQVDRACQGTCSISSDRCRFDTDCPDGETCTTFAPECAAGSCSLELVCVGGDNAGQPCRVHGPSGEFGTTSTDCPPSESLNFSGPGSQSNFEPSTSEFVSLDPEAFACTAPGFELYGCPCPSQGGAPTRPNFCNFACNAGAELGTGCATGSGAGQPTRCAGGDNAGKPCDADSDCAPGGGSCSDNPTHCIGDPDFELAACTTSADCGTGSCVDACPSGSCVALCSPTASDPEAGECTAGPDQGQCSGETFRVCAITDVTAGCDATCASSGTPCTADTECPSGETCEGACQRATSCEAGDDGVLGTLDDYPGAGVCTAALLACTLPGVPGEGGDIFNGEGDAINQKSYSAYCNPANLSAAANFGAGLPGAGRISSTSINVTNGFASLP